MRRSLVLTETPSEMYDSMNIQGITVRIPSFADFKQTGSPIRWPINLCSEKLCVRSLCDRAIEICSGWMCLILMV